ncbi:beta-lactamase/transpeptidase-like protein [Cladochytrium replicatum]|nr:beta-lactamase/transpeptidase-like protein [Cladochytrium replicatum]
MDLIEFEPSDGRSSSNYDDSSAFASAPHSPFGSYDRLNHIGSSPTLLDGLDSFETLAAAPPVQSSFTHAEHNELPAPARVRSSILQVLGSAFFGGQSATAHGAVPTANGQRVGRRWLPSGVGIRSLYRSTVRLPRSSATLDDLSPAASVISLDDVTLALPTAFSTSYEPPSKAKHRKRSRQASVEHPPPLQSLTVEQPRRFRFRFSRKMSKSDRDLERYYTRPRRVFRRAIVWLALLAAANYRYWIGRPHYPLICNLVSLRCPDWPIAGFVAPGYESVLEAFRENFKEGLEVGASFSAYVDNQPVVEIYGGYHDRNYKRLYDENTLQLVFSSSKVVEGIVLTYLVDRNLLSFESKIADYWPEFAQGNKENVTLACLLSHRAGVTFLRRQPTLSEISDLDRLAKLLASQEHNFNGTAVQGYHAVTRGWYLNEIVRRVDPKHRTLGQLLKQEIMPALGVEFYLGLPKELDSRVSLLVGFPLLRTVAKLVVPSRFQATPVSGGTKDLLFNRRSVSYKALAGSNPKQIRMWPHTHNRREIWRAEGPSYGGITNAKSLARMAALMANEGSLDGVRLISRETVRKALVPNTPAVDAVVGRNITYSTGGWGVGAQFPGVDANWEWVGWGGAGGSMVWWNWDPAKPSAGSTDSAASDDCSEASDDDEDVGGYRYRTPGRKGQPLVAFSYVQNGVGFTSNGDKRSWRLVAALTRSVDALEKARGNSLKSPNGGQIVDMNT